MPHIATIVTYLPWSGTARILNVFGVMVNGITLARPCGETFHAFDNAVVVRADKLRKSVSTDLSWVWKAVSAVMIPEGPGDDGK